jgi:hypothetical protein
VVLRQTLFVLGDRRDGRDGAVAEGAFAVCVLCLGPAGLICPELLQRRRRLVLRQHRRKLLQPPSKQPPSAQPAKPPFAPDQHSHRDEIGVAVRLAGVAPGKCAQPGEACVCEVDEIARKRVQARRQRLVLDAIEVRIAGGALPSDCVAGVGVSIACAIRVLAQRTRLSCRI